MDSYGHFRYWSGCRSLDDKRQIAWWNGTVSRFKGKLAQMIKDVNVRFQDYFILSVVRQVLLHWGYILIKDDLSWFTFLFM